MMGCMGVSMNLNEFLSMIAGDGYVHIRTQSTQDGDIEEYGLKPSEHEGQDMDTAFAQKSLDEKRNMWFQVGAVQSKTDKRPFQANVIWADVDVYKYPGGELQAVALMQRLPKPTVVVRSGSGFHVYWKLTKPVDARGPMSPAQIISKSVQWFLGGDAAHSPAKLLRLPGTYNFKPDKYEGGKLCFIEQVNDVEYDPEDFPVDEVLMRVGHKLMNKIMLGPDDPAVDRSEYDFAVVAELFQNGFSEQEVTYLLKTFPFSGKVRSEPHNVENYVSRTVKSALFKVQLNPGKIKKQRSDPVNWTGKSLSEILEEEKPPFIVTDFLPASGVAMLAAPPKARKSWAVMQLAHAVATGTPWLGFDIPQPRKVLYVQAELPNWMVAERIVQMYGSDPLDNVAFFYVPAANLLEDDDLQGLLDAVQSYEAELVIIDPVANFWQGDENSSSSVNQFFDQIAKIQALNCAVVMVHHTRKTEQNERLNPQHQRGSNVWFARPAAVMTLSPMIIPGEVPHTYAAFSLRAASPREDIKLFTDSTGKFTLTPPSLGDSGNPIRAKLTELLKKREQPRPDVLTYGEDHGTEVHPGN